MLFFDFNENVHQHHLKIWMVRFPTNMDYWHSIVIIYSKYLLLSFWKWLLYMIWFILYCPLGSHVTLFSANFNKNIYFENIFLYVQWDSKIANQRNKLNYDITILKISIQNLKGIIINVNWTVFFFVLFLSSHNSHCLTYKAMM